MCSKNILMDMWDLLKWTTSKYGWDFEAFPSAGVKPVLEARHQEAGNSVESWHVPVSTAGGTCLMEKQMTGCSISWPLRLFLDGFLNGFFFKKFKELKKNYVHECLPGCMSTWGSCRPEEGIRFSGTNYSWLWTAMWVLGFKP